MTDRVKILFPDGNVYPIKPGGYGGAEETRLPEKYRNLTDAQFKRLEPEIKKQALEAAISDVKDAYFLHVQAKLTPLLVQRWIQNPKTGKDSIGVFHKDAYLMAVLPGGGKMPLPLKEATRMSNKGASRIWFQGKPFSNLSPKTIELMIREGEGMVGITFSPPPIPEEYATLTQELTPRKFESKPGSIRSTSQINVANPAARSNRPGETARTVRYEKGYTREIQDPRDPGYFLSQVFIPAKEFPENKGKTVEAKREKICYEKDSWKTSRSQEPAKRNAELAGKCVMPKTPNVTRNLPVYRGGKDDVNGVKGYWKTVGRIKKTRQ